MILFVLPILRSEKAFGGLKEADLFPFHDEGGNIVCGLAYVLEQIREGFVANHFYVSPSPTPQRVEYLRGNRFFIEKNDVPMWPA